MKERRRNNKVEEYNLDDMKLYMRATPKEKLEFLEDINVFLNKVMTSEAKEISKELKKEGW